MKKTIFIFVALLLIGGVMAHGSEDFSQAEEIIKQKISCDDLTQDQLEILGDYYMEQMHPGEAHEYMDEMMGGEGSESLRQMHINMALSFYCGEHEESVNTMDIMMGRTGYNSYGMMSGYYGLNWIIQILVIVILVLLIIWLIRKLQDKGKGKR